MRYADYDDPAWIHRSEIPDLSHCHEMLEGIKEAVYKSGSIDQLEFCLDELLSMFEINICETSPLLEKKELSLFLGMVDLTKKYAQTIKEKK